MGRIVSRRRLIPAHAGKTASDGGSASARSAHPRSRGENDAALPRPLRKRGSSPLTRGKQAKWWCPSLACRLIPAHAGKTPRAVTRLPAHSAHPRSRGENRSTDNNKEDNMGSSPLTRGKRMVRLGQYADARLIPAHAGKTLACHTRRNCQRAHPRSRGENPCPLSRRGRPHGSSPLTRGKHVPVWPRNFRSRLIPAHAGKTFSCVLTCCQHRAHPRSRGENDPAACRDALIDGSSPLTRGKRVRRMATRRPGGLIPAHAGKTRSRRDRYAYRAAHPRSRGENCDAVGHVVADGGSSPLTRGKHFLTCAFTAQIDQILETLELAVSSGSYLIWVACATDAPQDPVRSIGLVLPSSRGAS